MNIIENKPHFTYENPYYPSGIVGRFMKFSKMEISLEERDRILAFADHIVKNKGSFLYSDVEKKLDIVNQVNNMVGLGMTGTTGGLQVVVFLENFLRLGINNIPFFKHFPIILNLVEIPSSIAYSGLGLIQGFFEFVNLRRAGLFLSKLENADESSLTKLQRIKAHYFSLSHKNSEKIVIFIDRALPMLNRAEKAEKFTKIADKILQTRFEVLKRRITPGLAEEVAGQLNNILKDLQSYYPSVRTDAEKRAQLLLDGLTRQAKTKILIHLLGLISITFSFVSIIGVFAAVTSSAFFIAMMLLTTFFVAAQIVIEKFALNKQVDQLYDQFRRINLPIMGGQEPPQVSAKAL